MYSVKPRARFHNGASETSISMVRKSQACRPVNSAISATRLISASLWQPLRRIDRASSVAELSGGSNAARTASKMSHPESAFKCFHSVNPSSGSYSKRTGQSCTRRLDVLARTFRAAIPLKRASSTHRRTSSGNWDLFRELGRPRL